MNPLVLRVSSRERAEISGAAYAGNCSCLRAVFSAFMHFKKDMDTRVAVISIIVEQEDAIEELNILLHEARQYIVGRMGIPYRPKGISIISIAIDAPQNTISALSGKIGRLKGVSAKTAYSNVITPAEEGAEQ